MPGDLTPEQLKEQYLKDFGIQEGTVIQISGGAAIATLAVPLALEFGPVLIQWAMKIYERYAQDPQTPAEKRASYADIATRLDAANSVVQNAPQPNPGSGR